jgi:hypothetical protein
VHAVVTDVTGRLVHASLHTLESGFHRLSLPLSNLAAGVYHLSLTAGESKAAFKLIRAD